MSIHIDAKAGDIADTVLLPGDPLRAKYVAENILKDSLCYNKVRGMYGFTGTYRGKKISIQGTGMGIPSCSIYIHELITEYQVNNLIRVGTCGSIQPDLKLRDIILAMTASTDSNSNKLRFQGMDYAPAANFNLLNKAFETASKMGKDVKVGSVFSTDTFYHNDPEYWRLWAKYGVLALEMETAALYTLAAQFGVNALSVLTVSDDIITGEKATSEERENAFTDMIRLALELGLV
jgi:purine-nucleoside phosphorylase